MKIDKPNYTQIPNIILDNMAEFTHVEFKVLMLICRYTFGFQRQSHKLSYSFIESACGLHCNSVNNAIHSLMSKGVITRSEQGDTFQYKINLEGVATLPDSPDYQIVQGTLPDSPLTTLPDSPKKETNKETSKETSKGNPLHKVMTKEWDRRWSKRFTTKYQWSGKDHKFVGEHLKSNPNITEEGIVNLIAIAAAAWSSSDAFVRKLALGIPSFLNNLSRIEAETKPSSGLQTSSIQSGTIPKYSGGNF